MTTTYEFADRIIDAADDDRCNWSLTVDTLIDKAVEDIADINTTNKLRKVIESTYNRSEELIKVYNCEHGTLIFINKIFKYLLEVVKEPVYHKTEIVTVNRVKNVINALEELMGFQDETYGYIMVSCYPDEEEVCEIMRGLHKAIVLISDEDMKEDFVDILCIESFCDDELKARMCEKIFSN